MQTNKQVLLLSSTDQVAIMISRVELSLSSQNDNQTNEYNLLVSMRNTQAFGYYH